MKDRTALKLILAVTMVAPATAISVLQTVGASSRLIALAYVLLLCVCVDTGVRAYLHYRR